MIKLLKYFNLLPIAIKKLSNGVTLELFRNGNIKTVTKIINDQKQLK
jgi:hypothetical protein